MKVRLVVETAPLAQAVTECVFTGGRLVIGRGDDADWTLNDPDMFMSRQHCILTEKDGQVMATDASSGGLFIDNAANPVGAGNAVAIEPGMRLRMGDVVLRVESADAPGLEPAPTGQAEQAEQTGRMVFDFGRKPDGPPPEPVERPSSLPDPFGLSGSGRNYERRRDPKPPKPLDQDDDFALDLRKHSPAAEPRPHRGGGYFDNPRPAAPPPADPDSTLAAGSDLFADWAAPPAEPEPPVAPPVEPEPQPDPPAARPANAPVAAARRPADGDLRDALLRGMGLDPAEFDGDPLQQAERIGQSMRLLVEGVMLLLRTRAQAKQKARVAQTIIASSDVNPLKFLASPEEVMASFIEPRGRGYLGPDDALREAFRDLTDHELRTWTALQTALRRMIDRFDPEEIETALEDVGVLENLIAGGRGAKLWRLYRERYRDIARSAEDQFLGEVGADFRDAYENDGRRRND